MSDLIDLIPDYEPDFGSRSNVRFSTDPVPASAHIAFEPKRVLPRRRVAVAGAALGVLAALGISTSASAHTADVTGTAVCEADGTFTVDWTVQTSNVPAQEEGEVKVISPVNVWLYEWAEHKQNHGLEPLTPNGSFVWSQPGIPGDATTASVMFQIDWHGHSSDPTGTVTLPGDCIPEPEPTVEPTVEPSPAPTQTPASPTPAPVQPAPSAAGTDSAPSTTPTVPAAELAETGPGDAGWLLIPAALLVAGGFLLCRKARS